MSDEARIERIKERIVAAAVDWFQALSLEQRASASVRLTASVHLLLTLQEHKRQEPANA